MTLMVWQPRPVARRQAASAHPWFWRPLSLWRATLAHSAWQPRVAVRETDDDIVVSAAVPGYEPGDLSVLFEHGMLVISGECERGDLGAEKDGRSWLLRERRQGRFHRSIALPVGVSTEHASARYENGVLIVRAPKVPEAKARRIKVEAA